jgi:hypothetical protein
MFRAFIAYIRSAATFTHQKMLFYREWLCLAQVSGTGNTRMVQHLVNTRSLYPSHNILSTAAAMVEATNDTNEHYDERKNPM